MVLLKPLKVTLGSSPRRNNNVQSVTRSDFDTLKGRNQTVTQKSQVEKFAYRGFSWWPCWRAETMKQFCMKIDLISQRRENVLLLPSNMAMMSHENAL